MSVRQGTYQWDIADPTLIKKITNSPNEQYFVSDVFKIGEINWRIFIFPNGRTEEEIGSFQVYLELIKLPSPWKSIIINRSIESPQTKSSHTAIATYTMSGQSFGWRANTLRLQEIKEWKFNKLIFVVRINILRIILKKNDKIFYHYKFIWVKHQKIIWNLDQNILRNAKKIYNGKKFESKIFNNMWCISLCPNGETAEYIGACIVILKLCAFPLNVSAIDVQWNLSIQQINFKQQSVSQLYKIGDCSSGLIIGSFNDFVNVKEMEIMIDVLILKEYDSNNKEIDIKSMQNEEEKNDFRDNVNEKLDLLSANIQEKDKEIELLKNELRHNNVAIKYQFTLFEAKIKALSSNFNQKMQEMRSMNEIQNVTIKSLNDRITTIFEEEKKENDNGNKNDMHNKLRFFFEYELNLPQYFDAIIDAGFTDILSLNDLTNEDLKEMNVKIARIEKKY